MKRFFLKLTLFSLIGLLLGSVLMFWLNRYYEEKIGPEVFDRIKASRAPASARRIIVGDSVARQLVNETCAPDAETVCLTTNQAVTLAGQYLLAANGVKNNPTAKELVLIYHPESFKSNLDQKTAVNYFLKPFYTLENLSEMTPTVLSRISTKPVCHVLVFPLFKRTQLFGQVDYSNGRNYEPQFYLSPISAEYLAKFETLAREKGLRLRIVPPPLSDRFPRDVRLLRQQIKELGLHPLFDDYWGRLRFVPDAQFKDVMHFKPEFVDAHRAAMRKMLAELNP